MRTALLTVFTFLTLLLNAHLSFAEYSPPKYAVGLGLEIVVGTFGTPSSSTFVTAPLIIDWFPTGRLDLELTVPFIYQRTANAGHVVLGTDVQSTTESVARGSMMSGGGGSILGGDYGLGDITLTSGFVLVMENDTSPRIRPSLYLKFPTADESKGFGTGKYDFGAGVAASKWFGNWQPFAEGRYIIQGAHDETGALNFVTADAGVAYSWSESLVTSTYVRFGSSLFDGISAPLEARLKTVWRFGERTFTEAYALKGFSDGSPEYGGGISVFMEF